jgi:hypothetical protein
MKPDAMELKAYLHITQDTKRAHLRVRQSRFTDNMKALLARAGSPAIWDQKSWEWDYPLTPATVIAVQEIAHSTGSSIEWSTDLQQYADYYIKLEQYEEQVRRSIEKAISEKQPLDQYPTNSFDGSLLPFHHQAVSYHWALRTSGLLLAHDPGCIDGKAVIKIRRAGKVFSVKLSDLYEKFHGGGKHPWTKDCPTSCKSLYDDGILRHNTILDVIYRGKKECVRLVLDDGKELICTPDHEIATQKGFVQAQQLSVGSMVLTNGTQVCSECGGTNNIITYKYAKYVGRCISCAHKGNRNGRWVDGRRKDKDGYIILSNMFGYPGANKRGLLREHIHVMQQHIGRPLLDSECVHHINGDKSDNRIANLQLTTVTEHAREHGRVDHFLHMDGGKAGTGGTIIFIPKECRIASIQSVGLRDVYDIVMDSPAHNFAANGVIVHNCGKTRSAADAAGGWYRHGHCAPMTQIWYPQSRAWNRASDLHAPPKGAWGVRGGLLIVAPKVMLKTWVDELRQWQNMTALDISGTRKRKVERLGMVAHAHVINYESLPLLAQIGSVYDAIIVDESHRCANHTDQTMNVLDMAMKAKKRMLLTGTPVSNSLEAVFYQMLITDGGRALGSSKTKFLEAYFNSQATNNGQTTYTPREGAIQAVSAKMAKCTYFLKKDEVLDLPEKTHTPLYLQMTDDQARYYEQVRQDSISYIQDSTVTAEMAATRMMKLAQICQGFVIDDNKEVRHFNDTKSQAMTDLVLNTYAGRKLVIWCRFTYEIDRLCEFLKKSGVAYLRYDGKIPQRERDWAKETWQTDPRYTVFVGQVQMGIGITLHAGTCSLPCADTAYLSLDFSFVNWVQSMDRIHRIGQRWPCSYTYLLTENGIDRRIYQSLQIKAQTADAVHKAGKEFYLSLLTDDTPRLAMID